MPIIGQSPSQDLVAALHDLHPNLPAQTLSFLLPPPPTRRPRTRRTSHPTIDKQADVRQHVPVKFEHRTEDGLWVKSECWDLHGQQLCQVCLYLVLLPTPLVITPLSFSCRAHGIPILHQINLVKSLLHPLPRHHHHPLPLPPSPLLHPLLHHPLPQLR